jgi:hypothetical protein
MCDDIRGLRSASLSSGAVPPMHQRVCAGRTAWRPQRRVGWRFNELAMHHCAAQ